MKIIILFLLIFTSSYAQEMTEKPDPIQIIMMGKGKISKREYNEFWRHLEVKNKEEKAATILSMRQSFLPMQEYQKEIWTCAEIAYKKRKNVSCNKSLEVINAYKKSSKLGNQNPYVKELEKMGEKILNAAAKREKLYLVNNEDGFNLDEKSIKESKEAFTSGVDRLKQVLVLEYK